MLGVVAKHQDEALGAALNGKKASAHGLEKLGLEAVGTTSDGRKVFELPDGTKVVCSTGCVTFAHYFEKAEFAGSNYRWYRGAKGWVLEGCASPCDDLLEKINTLFERHRKNGLLDADEVGVLEGIEKRLKEIQNAAPNPSQGGDVCPLRNYFEAHDSEISQLADDVNGIAKRHGVRFAGPIIRFARANQYPHHFEPGVREEVIRRATNASGQVIDPDGKVIPKHLITIEHNIPVQTHWNVEGRFSSRAARTKWYNELDNLSVKRGPDNFAEGGRMGDFIQETGEGYSN